MRVLKGVKAEFYCGKSLEDGGGCPRPESDRCAAGCERFDSFKRMLEGLEGGPFRLVSFEPVRRPGGCEVVMDDFRFGAGDGEAASECS